MKTVKELKMAKDAILKDVDLNKNGKQLTCSTNYYGPSNPASITTFIDGFNMGSDNGRGSYGDDSWNIALGRVDIGKLYIESIQ
ncbi:MAG: hypothetical protein LBV69_12290 [Bacteroidales bacterium]|jgi:hypothetical protein|nr:hypothetical protein [Bacteroidales bacterium]